MDTIVESMGAVLVTWRRLLYLAVAGNLVILLYMMTVLGDTLALALVAIYLIGLGLLKFRSGELGIILIGLLSADIAVWTASGAISNFLSGERLTATILPGFLGVISLMGVSAAIATWITRKNPDKGSQAAQLMGQFALVLLLIITVSGLVIRQRPTQAASSTNIPLTTENMKFSQEELVSDSREVTIHLSNHDLWWHTFTIDELGVDLKVPMGAEREITFSAPPGTYNYYCSIPGHDAIMHGTLTIQE